MRENVIEIIMDVLKITREELEAEFDSKDIWDSLLRVEVLFAVEDEFDISFEEEELVELNTPKKLCEAILGKVE